MISAIFTEKKGDFFECHLSASYGGFFERSIYDYPHVLEQILKNNSIVDQLKAMGLSPENGSLSQEIYLYSLLIKKLAIGKTCEVIFLGEKTELELLFPLVNFSPCVWNHFIFTKQKNNKQVFDSENDFLEYIENEKPKRKKEKEIKTGFVDFEEYVNRTNKVVIDKGASFHKGSIEWNEIQKIDQLFKGPSTTFNFLIFQKEIGEEINDLLLQKVRPELKEILNLVDFMITVQLSNRTANSNHLIIYSRQSSFEMLKRIGYRLDQFIYHFETIIQDNASLLSEEAVIKFKTSLDLITANFFK